MRRAVATPRYTATLILLAAGAWFSPVAYAGQGVWTSGGPYGGNITALAIDPANSALLYAGTPGGRVFKSTNGGKSWTFKVGLTPTSPWVLQPSVYALAIDPATPTTLYAGRIRLTTSRWWRVFKSTDSGGTWVATGGLRLRRRSGHRSHDPRHALRRDERRRGLQVHRLRRHLGRRQRGPDEPGRPRPGHRSHDPRHALRRDARRRGLQVHRLRRHLGRRQHGPDEPERLALAIDPTTPATLYAGTSSGGVFKSTDSGGTWAAANTGLTNLYVRRPGHRSHDPRHALRRDGRRRGLQVHRLRRHLGRREHGPDRT